jgi:hypothetical protein
LLKEGKIKTILGLDEVEKDSAVVAIVRRLDEGDIVRKEWIGTEKQVLARLYLVCESKEELAQKITYYQNSIKVSDENGQNMLLAGFDSKAALEIER